ncbi:MAG TPA: AAA family ATPase [Deltaproteobacteria bacterium]|nr:AAA family ATPase [Deltaproteobacteria bacterium]
MFEQFFGLSENPFNVTPDPKFLFLSKAHDEALSYLRYGIEQRKGFIMITGEVGAGKTTICRALLSSLPRTVRTALILNPALSDVELLQAINQDFGITASHSSKKALLDELYEFLINAFVGGENAVLIIDECQNLCPDVLEQIRMLSNLETEKEKLLQIVLVGQPELAKMLSSPAMKQIDDRIVLRYHIWPLKLWDTRSYINHRLIISGSHGEITFTPLAYRLIYRYSHGIPRRINAVAERSLLIAYLRSSRRITARIVMGAIRELEGNYAHRRRLRPALLIPAFAIVALVAGIFLWNGMSHPVQEFSNLMTVANTPEVEASLPPPSRPGPDEGMNVQEAAPVLHEAPVRDFRAWIMKDYQAAIEVLMQLPEGIVGPDDMNLHPQPAFMKYLPMPAIVSMDGGYMVMLKADPAFVQVVGRDKAVIEIPMAEFTRLYRWNVMVPYAKPLHTTIFQLNAAGDKVEEIQQVLAHMGVLDIEPNGVYGIETAKGVERFQEIFGLRRDGIVGHETMVLIRSIREAML